jgi:hypothetical protein
MATKLTIPAGTTHAEVIRWASDVVAYKAISGISKSAPAAVTVPSHGLKTGWPVAVESVKGMTQINAQNSPPRESDLHAITSTGTDTLTLDGVNAIGFSTYTGGGALRYNVPESLAAATARMHLVDRWRPLSAGISYPHKTVHGLSRSATSCMSTSARITAALSAGRLHRPGRAICCPATGR